MTETEVEAPAESAVEYPPERVRLPVAPGDRVVVLGTVNDHEGRYIGKVAKVVGAHHNRDNAEHFINVEDDEGTRYYVNNWVHLWVVNLAKEPEPLPTASIGDTVTILRSLCCQAAQGMQGVVAGVNGDMTTVDVAMPDGSTQSHVANFTSAQVRTGVSPLDYVENNPKVKTGDVVYVLRSDTSAAYNFHLATVSDVRAYASEYRDHLYVTMGNHKEAWVSTWIRAEDIPATMQPVEGGTKVFGLDVFGTTHESAIGSAGEVYDWVANQGIRIIEGGQYLRLRQWVTLPEGEPQRSSHRQALPKNTRVRVLSVKSADRKNLVGRMGVTTADIDPKREACIVEVDGERVLVTGWTAVDKQGNPATPRYLSMMTDAEVEALIEEVFQVADKLADKESWCETYDQVMRDVIGRAPGTIRLTQKWLVEVLVVGEGRDKKPKEGKPIRGQYEMVRLFAMGNQRSPSREMVEQILNTHEKYKGAEFSINNHWREG